MYKFGQFEGFFEILNYIMGEFCLSFRIVIIDYLVDQEIQSREARSKAVRMRIAGFPFNKRLADFDFKYQEHAQWVE